MGAPSRVRGVPPSRHDLLVVVVCALFFAHASAMIVVILALFVLLFVLVVLLDVADESVFTVTVGGTCVTDRARGRAGEQAEGCEQRNEGADLHGYLPCAG